MAVVEGIIGFTGVLVGGLITSGMNYLSSNRRIEFEKTKFITETETANKKLIDEKLNTDKESIISIVMEVKSENSLTMNYIMEDKRTTNIEIHDRYLKNAQKIRNAIVKARISFKTVVDLLEGIYSINNQIWGLQQNYFGFSKNNKKSKDDLRNKLVELFNTTKEECNKILNILW